MEVAWLCGCSMNITAESLELQDNSPFIAIGRNFLACGAKLLLHLNFAGS
jgi:hypothetical protein